MNKSKQHNSLTESAHISLEQMQAYLEDTLPSRHMHQVERHLLDCELCSDALEGLSSVPQPDHIPDIVGKLKQTIRKKSLRQPIIRRKKKLVTILWKPMSVAAAILILITAVFLLMRIDKKYRNTPEGISMAGGKQADKPMQSKPQPAAPEPELQQEAMPQQEPVAHSADNKRAAKPSKAKSPVQEKDELFLAEEASTDEVTIGPAPSAPEAAKEETQTKALPSLPPVTEAKKARSADELPQHDRTLLSTRTGIAQSSLMVSGKVTYAGDESPLAGVNVLVKGTNQGTVTDAEGNFKLLAPLESSLVFNYIGFKTEEVQVKSQEALKISMKDDVSALSEVLVTEGNTDKGTADYLLIKPQPVKGFPNYKNYLRMQLKYPETALQNKIEGNVRVEFMVDTDGTLSDFKVKKGLGYGCDEEAIRLIKEGPVWKPATRNNELVKRRFSIIVPFKLK